MRFDLPTCAIRLDDCAFFWQECSKTPDQGALFCTPMARMRRDVLLLLLLTSTVSGLDVNAYVCVYSAAVRDRDTTSNSDPYFKVQTRESSSDSWANVCQTSTDSNDNTPSWGSSGDCCNTAVLSTTGQIRFAGYDEDVGSPDSLGTTAAKTISSIWTMVQIHS